METCYYETVETIPEREDNDDTISRKHLWRQRWLNSYYLDKKVQFNVMTPTSLVITIFNLIILVCSGIYFVNFCYGLTFGTPTVLISQLRQEANSSDVVSIEMASWLSCTLNYSGSVSAIILAILARLIGRKLSFLLVCITSLIGYIIFYYSTSITQIIVSEIILGPVAATTLTVSTMVLTEYMSPRYRGIFLTFKSAIFLWGVWIANAIGTFLHWKIIGVLGFICCMYSSMTVPWWPESPYWLANKYRFEDCAASHRWLKGCGKESEEELEKLIETQKVTQSLPSKARFTKMFRSKPFYKPISLSFLVLLLYHFSGKIACVMYSIDIIKRITGTTSTAYVGMLILDGVTVLGAYIGCALSKVIKRKPMLLVSSTVGVIFLFITSFYLYLVHFEIISEDNIISLLLLTGYSIAISIGPMIMSTTILGELIPLKYRSSSVLFFGCFTNLVMAAVMNISPFILDYCGVRGLFLFFAVMASLLIILNYKLLPETKDKTILEIQECLLGNKPTTESTD